MTKSKTMKVYNVSFNEFVQFGKDSGDFENDKAFVVLGEDVEQAIESAKEFLSKKELKSYYVGEVTHLQTLD